MFSESCNAVSRGVTTYNQKCKMQAIYLSGLTKAVYILLVCVRACVRARARACVCVCEGGLGRLVLRFLYHTQVDKQTSERVINSSQSPHTIHIYTSTVQIVLSGISGGKGLPDIAIVRISEC
jgi:hypothetical protein